MHRQCGACTLCCKLLPVWELGKAANTKCGAQYSRGCRIYHQAGFPASCALWSCRWLQGEPGIPRPDHAGWVLDVIPDAVKARNNETGEVTMIPVIVAWVAPGTDALRDDRLLAYAERKAKEDHVGLLLRYGTDRAVAVFPPGIATDNEWHVIDGEHMQRVNTVTGNLLLEAMAQQRQTSANIGENGGTPSQEFPAA